MFNMNFIYHIYNDIYFINDKFVKVDKVEDFFPCFTWRPNKYIFHEDNIYCSYYKRDAVLPSDIRKNNKIREYISLLQKNQIHLNHENLFLSMNNGFIKKYLLDIKNLCQDLMDSGLYYDKSYNIPYRVIVEIERNPLNLIGDLSKYDNYLTFNPFTKTYRLTNEDGSLYLYNLRQDQRKDIKPNNDLFVEFDYNSAEFRILMNKFGYDVGCVEDLYEEYKQLFNASSREEAKKKYFESVYANIVDNKELRKLLNKFINDVYNSTFITTPYEARIYTDEVKKVASLYCQTCCSFLIYEKCLEIVNFLNKNDCKSHLSFTYHDAIILDISIDEISLIKESFSNINNTMFGNMPGRFKAGPDYGSMKTFRFK